MMLSDVCLSNVCCVACIGLAQDCRCALPLQAWAGHIVAAARLQLVNAELLYMMSFMLGLRFAFARLVVIECMFI